MGRVCVLGFTHTAASRLFFGGGGVSALFVSRRVESGRILQRHRGKQVALVKLQGINDRYSSDSFRRRNARGNDRERINNNS